MFSFFFQDYLRIIYDEQPTEPDSGNESSMSVLDKAAELPLPDSGSSSLALFESVESDRSSILCTTTDQDLSDQPHSDDFSN